MASVRIAGLSAVLVMLSLHQGSAQVQSSVSAALPSLGEPAKAGSSEDGIYCRPPQPLTDSRLAGPKVCKPIKEWNALHASGMDVDPHGDIKPIQNLDELKNH